MTLRDHFEHSGNWLFRWRSYLPLIFFVVLAFGLRSFRTSPDNYSHAADFDILAFTVGMVGLLVRGYAVGYSAYGTSGRVTRNQEARALNTTGLYSVVRHPLYVGNYLMWLSATMCTRSMWAVVVVSLIFWLYYERIMFAEESFLRRQFGEVFDRWAATTPAFLPSIKHWRAPTSSFVWRRVLRRERSGLLGLAATFFAIHFAVDWAGGAPMHLSSLWTVVFASSLLFYAVMEIDTRIVRARAKKTAT